MKHKVDLDNSYFFNEGALFTVDHITAEIEEVSRNPEEVEAVRAMLMFYDAYETIFENGASLFVSDSFWGDTQPLIEACLRKIAGE